MSEKTTELANVVDSLKQQRDELAVKIHLARADARDEWQKVERKWQEIEARVPRLKREVGIAGGNVSAALQLAAEEVAAGYRRIRSLL